MSPTSSESRSHSVPLVEDAGAARNLAALEAGHA